jgi:hypothetical protein
MSGRMKFGKCRLTGRRGHFVKSHIIPEALTEVTWRGQPLTQQGKGGQLIKRWTSWYDDKLVTSEGEAVLQKYDDWAITFFRKHKLIWSAIFPPLGRLETADHQWCDELNMGIRRIVDETSMLRLFFLSLLWRAATTNRFEFGSVAIPADDREKLREMVLSGRAVPHEFYQITLTQLITIGFPHNWSAYRYTKTIPNVGTDDSPRVVDIFRFYFDGLIAHMHINDDPEIVTKQAGFFVGQASETLVTTLRAQDSLQMKRFWDRAQNVDRSN